MFVFIRTDLPLQHQIVQSNHAVYHLASLRGPDEGIPNIVLIGLPNVESLKRALKKLSANQIPHYAWTEPDHDFGLTAIATAPISGAQRAALINYRVYAPAVAVNSANSKSVDAGSTPGGRANAGMVGC